MRFDDAGGGAQPWGGQDCQRPVTPADETFLHSLAEWMTSHADLPREDDYLGRWRDVDNEITGPAWSPSLVIATAARNPH